MASAPCSVTCHPSVALLLGHAAGRVGEVDHDVDDGAHAAALLVEDLDARAEDGLLRPAVGAEAAHRLAERSGGRRGVDVPVPQRAHGDEHVVERLPEHGAGHRGLGEASLEVAGLEVGQLGDPEQAVGDRCGLVGGEPAWMAASRSRRS